MENPNEKPENQKSTKNNNDLDGNATQKQITDVSQKFVKLKSNKGPIDQFVRVQDAFKRNHPKVQRVETKKTQRF